MRRNRNGISRRTFLRGAGGVAVGLPLLESLSGTAIARPDGGGPRRIISFYHPQGMIMNAWRPSTTGAGFDLPEILEPLSAVNPATGNPLRDDILVISGLDNPITNLNNNAGGHFSGSRTLFTSMPLADNLAPDGTLLPEAQHVMNEDYTHEAGGPSIEQVVASRVGADTMYRSVDFAIGNREFARHMQAFYGGSDDPIEPEDDPTAAFDRLFADLDVDDPTPLQRIRAARGSVLDTVGESFTQLQARVGAADRQRLEEHLDRVRQLEMQVGGGIALPACGTPEIGGFGVYDPTSNSDAGSDVVAPQMIDMAVMALACDLTRTATIQFSMWHDPRFEWLGANIPGQWEGWHGMIHEGRETADGRPAMIAAMRWYTEMFAHLLQQLASVPEGDGTMLDNTLVVWMSEFGDGQAHATNDLPVILAGSACGRVNTGLHIDHTGRTTGDLHTTILHAFGGDDPTFGYVGETWSGPTVSGPLDGVLA